MKPHPYLRAYMAGIAVPTPFLLVAVTGFTIGRSLGLPVALDHVILFPMAVVPNLWGIWNMLRLALGAGDRWSIGVHGAVLPLLLIPLGLLLARVFAIDIITAGRVAVFAPLVILVYYLAWKYLVGYFNAFLGIA